MKPRNSAEIRAFLNRRADSRPQNALPAVKIDGTTATLRLFDPIDSWGEWWGMSAKELAQALDDLPSHIATIELLINSPGGDAFDGLAMVNVLRAHPAKTRAVVQGIAASAASFIACAADETVMAPNSTMMIHDAWGVCAGNADDMLSFGAVLDQLSGNLAEIYATKSGKSADEMRAAMKAETWYTADEAIAAKLADSLAAAADIEPVANDAKPRPAAGAPPFLEIAANANRRRR
jgi:ATP-dependent protease ClpP protease subunit